MRIGIFGGDVDTAKGNGIDAVVAAAAAAEQAGFATYWLPQIFGLDALTVLAIVGREVPRIELGTAVVPIQPRHVTVLAQQALTTNLACGDRLALGIGLSHQLVVEGMWGLPFDKPASQMEEYLTALRSLVTDRSATLEGEQVTVRNGMVLIDAPPPRLLVAALGPRMLKMAARMSEGTITWMTGPETLSTYTVPTITAAANEAGRPAPRICAGFPVCVTDEADAARTLAAEQFQIYGQLPSYRAMLDREGAGTPADIAIVGDEATVEAAIRHLDAAGVTDLVANEFGNPDERKRTRAVLSSFV
jgi:F420-dependent oxidoreductase-like protein